MMMVTVMMTMVMMPMVTMVDAGEDSGGRCGS